MEDAHCCQTNEPTLYALSPNTSYSLCDHLPDGCIVFGRHLTAFPDAAAPAGSRTAANSSQQVFDETRVYTEVLQKYSGKRNGENERFHSTRMLARALILMSSLQSKALTSPPREVRTPCMSHAVAE